jgi:hypothetical protein
MKADQERVSKLLTDTVTLLCKNGLVYSQEIKVQGLLGITLDKNDVFIVHINEVIGDSVLPTSRDTPQTCTTTNTSTSESSRRKNSSSNVSVVDLTRIADTPLPLAAAHPQQLASIAVPGTGTAGRKQQRSVPLVPPPPQLVAAQQMAQRMAYSPRLAARRNTNVMQQQHQQQAFNSQMAATYLAQLHQQVSRGMMRLPPPLRQRSVSRRPQPVVAATVQSTPSSTAPAAVSGPGTDDDEDVVIIGTGHEEPSPNWNSPARRHPLPSRASGNTPTSAATTQCKASPCATNICMQQPQQSTASASNSGCISQLVETNSVIGGLKLTAEDIPLTVSELQMNPSTATSSQLLNKGIEAKATTGVTEYIKVSSDISCGDEVRDKAVTENDRPAKSDTNLSDVAQCNTVEQSHQPFVYTDIAGVSCDMEELARSESLMEIEIPGFDLLTSDDQSSTERMHGTFNCQVANCLMSFTEANELADHYVIAHSNCMDLTACSPTVIEPTSDAVDSDAIDRQQQPTVAAVALTCPFVSCGLQLSSYPGLLMHHKRQHGTPLPTSVRQVIMATRRALKKSLSSVARQAPSQLANSNFVCLVSECGMSCPSREELIEHLRSVHPDMVSSVADRGSGNVQVVCKEENMDDKT